MALMWCPIAARATVFGEQHVVNLTLHDGLAGETVYAVMTDHNGYTWIATNSGVNVFNGNRLTTFRLLGEQGRRLVVYGLCERNDSQIWAATEDGLFCLEEAGEGRFERVLPEVQEPTSLLAVGDTLYIGSQQGLQFYDGRQLQHIDVDVSHSGIDNVVRQYVRGDDGRIWFLGRYDLNSYDPQSGRVMRHQPSLSERRLILSQFAYVGHDRFVVGSRANGLYLCDLRTGTTERIEGVGNVVTSVQRSADGNICVACDGAGAFLLDGASLSIKEHFHSEAEDLHALPSNAAYCYYRDANGVNWFGFVRRGLAYTYHSGDLFRVFNVASHDEGTGFSSEGINVRTFCRHGDDVILGTFNGFYYVNAQTGQYRFYSPAELGGSHIVNTVAWYEDRFYIGTFDGGLHTFDPQTQTLQRQRIAALLNDIAIGDLKVGPDGRLWIGCTHGLVIVKDGRIEQHFTEQNSRITGGLIISITFDSSGNAWLTGADGCSLYSVRSHEIVETTFPEGFFNQMPWMRGAQGHDGLVLMRTGPQTFYTNEQMTDFGELQLPVKFSDKWCRGLVDDMQGHYLFASERGVFRFDYALQEMQHFGYGEGLRGSYINDMAMGPDGRLWVSTSQGLFYSDAAALDCWKQETRYWVQLFNIRRGSDLLASDEEYRVNEELRIRLTWNFTSEVLQLSPILLDYSKPTGRLYEYRLGDADWQLVAQDEAIDVRHLLLGLHSLEVRLAGVEGTTTVYTIVVAPSVWAFVELALLLAALLLLWLWWRYRKNTRVLLSERKEMENALIEMEQQEAMLAERQEEAEEAGGNKYQQVKMSDEECAEIVDGMRHFLETEHAYTNPNLQRADLARVLHVPVAKLSYVFSMYLKENYYEFINRYRLERFKQMIADGEYKRFTLTALSEQCGFRKSSFFSTFRKVEGMTPTEYLRRQHIKMEL